MKQPTTRAAWLAVVAGALLMLGLVPALAIAADASVSMTEQSGQYVFAPDEVTINVGDSVTWTNNSDAPHTVTADDNSFDHSNVGLDGMVSETFDSAGDFTYHCDFHPGMTGTVHVLAASATESPGATGSPGTTQPPTDTSQPGAATPGALPWLSLFAGLIALVVLSGLALRLPRRADR